MIGFIGIYRHKNRLKAACSFGDVFFPSPTQWNEMESNRNLSVREINHYQIVCYRIDALHKGYRYLLVFAFLPMD